MKGDQSGLTRSLVYGQVLRSQLRFFLLSSPLILPLLLGICGMMTVYRGGWWYGAVIFVLTLMFVTMPWRKASLGVVFGLGLWGNFALREGDRERWQKFVEEYPGYEMEGVVIRSVGKKYLMEGRVLVPDSMKDMEGCPQWRTRWIVSVPENKILDIGKEYRGKGEAIELRERLLPGGFDRAFWLMGMGCAGELRWTQYKKVGEGGVMGGLDALSARINERLCAWVDGHFPQIEQNGEKLGGQSDDPCADVINSTVFGAKDRADASLIEDFRRGGVLHVFAVSGLHVGIVLMLIGGVCRLFRMRPGRAIALMCFCVMGYVFVVGMPVSAMRAGWMIVLLLVSGLWGRKVSVVNRLAFVALVLLYWDPFSLFQMGFRLSFSIFAVVVISLVTFKSWSMLWTPDPFIPKPFYSWGQKLRVLVMNSVGTTCFIALSAWVVSTFILAGELYYFSPYAALINVGLSVPVFLLMALVGASLMTSWIPGLGEGIFWLAKQCAYLILALVQWGAQLPDAVIPYRASFPSGQVTIVPTRGQNYAAFLGSPAFLLECGGPEDVPFTLMPAMNALGFRPQALVVSHLHHAQIGGASVWVEKLGLKEMYLPMLLPEKILDMPLKPTLIQQGQMWRVKSSEDGSPANQAEFRVLFVAVESRSRGDDRVAIYEWRRGDFSIIFMSDAGIETEQKLIELYPDIKADVLVYGAHSTSLSCTKAFLEKVRPHTLVLTDGDRWNRPNRSEEGERYAQEQNMTIHRLHSDGAVTF